MRLFQTTAATLVTFCASCAFLFAVSAQGASFDCGKAKTKVEHLICDDAEISKLDEELNESYKAALKDKAQAASIKQAQKLWIKGRNRCTDAACVRGAYQKRISELAQTKAMLSGDAVEEYALLMSKSDEMCGHMSQLMNDDLRQFDRTFDSNDRFVGSHEEFTSVPWRPARASLESGRQVRFTDIEGALFDLNNDGVVDFVV